LFLTHPKRRDEYFPAACFFRRKNPHSCYQVAKKKRTPNKVLTYCLSGTPGKRKERSRRGLLVKAAVNYFSPATGEKKSSGPYHIIWERGGKRNRF